jgi:hypothetical protein
MKMTTSIMDQRDLDHHRLPQSSRSHPPTGDDDIHFERLIMLESIARAQTEHAVCFLLTDYLEACTHKVPQAVLPDAIKRFPLAGEGDIANRLRDLEDHCGVQQMDGAAAAHPLVTEAVAVLRAATERLRVLKVRGPNPALDRIRVLLRQRRGSPHLQRIAARTSSRP